jgi:hypothetical protein
MGKLRLSIDRRVRLLDAINSVARELDAPVIGKVLIENGIATREELRKLVRAKRLIECNITFRELGKQVFKAYYTPDVIPKEFRKEGMDNAANGEPSEVNAVL